MVGCTISEYAEETHSEEETKSETQDSERVLPTFSVQRCSEGVLQCLFVETQSCKNSLGRVGATRHGI